MRRTVERFALLVTIALSGCSSSESTGAPTDAADAGGADAGALECPKGTHATEGQRACEGKLVVETLPIAIAPVRDHHTTHRVDTSTGTYLYVVGGTDAWKTIFSDVQRAKVEPGGQLGSLEAVAELPVPRAGHCTIIAKDRITIIGGSGMNGQSQSIFSDSHTAAFTDGAIGAWEKGPALPKPLMHQTCDVHGDYVYVIGGRSFSGSTTTSLRSRIGEDGKLGEFEPMPELSPDRSHHQAFIHGGRLYVAGGLQGDPSKNPPSRDDIVSAPIGADGALGAWEPAGKLAAPLSISAAVEYGQAIYMIGGLEQGTRYSARIQRLVFDEAGQVSASVMETRLSEGRGHVHQTPMVENHIYSIGGHDSGGASIGRIDRLTFE